MVSCNNSSAPASPSRLHHKSCSMNLWASRAVEHLLHEKAASTGSPRSLAPPANHSPVRQVMQCHHLHGEGARPAELVVVREPEHLLKRTPVDLGARFSSACRSLTKYRSCLLSSSLLGSLLAVLRRLITHRIARKHPLGGHEPAQWPHSTKAELAVVTALLQGRLE